jgi:hypothetical protein
MYSEQLVLRDAVIDSTHHKTQEGKVQTRIQVHGSLNQEVADVLGIKSLVFAHNGTPKDGFSTLQLDTGCAPFRAVFEADPALKQSFEITSGDSTDRFVLERQEGGLKLKMRLNYHGDPHAALAYTVAVGNFESKLKIVPLQSTLDTKPADEESKQEPEPAPATAPASAETVRQAMAGGRRKSNRRQAGLQ